MIVRAAAAAAAVVAACAALAGCGAGPAVPRSVATSHRSGPAATAPAAFDLRPGWTAAGVQGVAPAPRSCHTRPGPDGSTLPDPVCTPGATDPSSPSTVSSDELRELASAARTPPADIRAAAQAVVFGAYGVPPDPGSGFTLDTLIPIALGGSWDYRNLWPAPAPATFAPNPSFRNDKDVTGVYLRDAVARRSVSLSSVQDALARNWATAVTALSLPAIPRSYSQGG